MIEVSKAKNIETKASEIKYPVARKCKDSGQVVLFWDEHTCTVVFPGENQLNAGLTYGGLSSCMDEDEWEPVDAHIYG